MQHHFLTVAVAVALLLTGCAGKQASQPKALSEREVPLLQSPQYVDAVKATCRPPSDWRAEPIKKTDVSQHQIWISPAGGTAYGVLNVRHLLMPLASHERVLNEFLEGMRKSEGSAELLEKNPDPQLAGLGGVRFIARGGTYTVRANLVSSGRNAWIWYAGTLTGKPVHEEDLRTAEMAREQTVVGEAVATEANGQ